MGLEEAKNGHQIAFGTCLNFYWHAFLGTLEASFNFLFQVM